MGAGRRAERPPRPATRRVGLPARRPRPAPGGHLPGLVALPAEGLAALDLQPRYGSLHALLRDLGLQWLEQGGVIEVLPQALLRREPQSNPTLLPISTPAQRQLFTADQLLEIEQLSQRRAPAWLAPGGRLQPGPRQGSVLLRYAPGPSTRVSVIIPFRDQAQLTRQCVLSLLEQAGPTPLELVLVDNGSTEPEAIGLAAELAPQAAQRGLALIGVRDDSPFNFAALNNRARKHCSGTFLLFLNNDIRFASPRPIEALLAPFALASTGAVSARLLFEDGTIQHHGLAAAPRQPHDILSPGKGLRPGVATEPFAALELPEQWSAATAACLLMRTADFDRLGPGRAGSAVCQAAESERLEDGVVAGAAPGGCASQAGARGPEHARGSRAPRRPPHCVHKRRRPVRGVGDGELPASLEVRTAA